MDFILKVTGIKMMAFELSDLIYLCMLLLTASRTDYKERRLLNIRRPIGELLQGSGQELIKTKKLKFELR